MRRTRLSWAAVAPVLALGAMMVSCASCGDHEEDGPSVPDTDSICCTEFNVGADLQGVDFGVDASVKGQFGAFAQAAADVGAIAAASLAEVELACRNLATDFGATPEARAAAYAYAEAPSRAIAWCELAVATIQGSLGAGGKFLAARQVTVSVVPATCSASVSAAANCSAQCSVGGECDVQSNPPTCEGGKMEVSCRGSCTAEAGTSVACRGKCTGKCEGSCTATGGVAVDCNGTCDGTCEVSGGGNDGIQADSTCKGRCNGTCTASVDTPAVECSGICNGTCDASCEAEAGGSVKCDGECSGSVEPLACKGGELRSSCEVDEDCEAGCSATASAKASCTPPTIRIVASGANNLDAIVMSDWVAAVDSLEANLAIIFRVKAKAEAAVEIVAVAASRFSWGGIAWLDPAKLGAKGTACLFPTIAAFVTAAEQLEASLFASTHVVTSFGG